jgi:hypothetical protein
MLPTEIDAETQTWSLRSLPFCYRSRLGCSIRSDGTAVGSVQVGGGPVHDVGVRLARSALEGDAYRKQRFGPHPALHLPRWHRSGEEVALSAVTAE